MDHIEFLGLADEDELEVFVRRVVTGQSDKAAAAAFFRSNSGK
jgi:hypothetical protein